MKTYIYVPKSLDAADFFAQAKESGISQIIHGESDIISEYVEDYSNPFIINIPQLRLIWLDKHVFEESEDIHLVFVDEWIVKDKYKSISAMAYKVDIDDPSKMNFYKEYKMGHDGKYTFYEKINIDEYGEFFVIVEAIYEDGGRRKLDETELIIYKKQEEPGFDL